MKKENILSVLIDESGDFGKLDYNDPYYYVLMVLHKQNNSIADMVDALEEKLRNWGYENHYIHVGPLIRREKPYQNDLREDRKSLFNALFHFARLAPIDAGRPKPIVPKPPDVMKFLELIVLKISEVII